MNYKMLLVAAIATAVYSCNMDTADHTREISQMEDSVFAAFPTVNRVTIKVTSDFSKEIHVTMGDKELYNASEDERTKAVSRTREIIKNIFKDRSPAKGEVIFSEEENKISAEDAAKKTYPVVLKEEE